MQGWELTGKGRIYRVHDPGTDRDPLVLETKKLLGEGMIRRSVKELTTLLAHPDMRVRQEAQFALAERGAAALKTLSQTARQRANQFARIHAIWAIGQILSKYPPSHSSGPEIIKTEAGLGVDLLLELLSDGDAEVRAQAAKTLGERRVGKSYEGLIKLLRDANPRVRFFAAQSLGKLGRRETLPAIFSMLRENADRDPYLRHAAVMALTWIDDMEGLLAAALDKSPAVRMGVLLAMRRLHRSEVTLFLHDADFSLILEAARAVNDEPINGGMTDLAQLIDLTLWQGPSLQGSGQVKEQNNEGEDFRIPLLRRILNANFHVGTAESAKALATFAARPEAPETMRVEALEELADWLHPSGRDRVMGLWRPVAAIRPREPAAEALRGTLVSILKSAPAAVRIAALHATEKLTVTEVGPILSELVTDRGLPGDVRGAALRTLAALNDPALETNLKAAQSDPDEEVRRAATLLQGKINSSQAGLALANTLENGTMNEKQAALAVLGELQNETADKTIASWLEKLIDGRVPKEIQLDLIEAAAKRSDPVVKEKLSSYRALQSKDDPLAEFMPTLFGGKAQEGRKIFFDRPETQCVRCHKISGEGGDVGPDLSHISSQRSRQYLLESIVLPNKQIAPGFESVTVAMKNGEIYAGVLKSEDAGQLIINSPDSGLLTVKKEEIQSRQKALSPMPEGMGQILSKQDLRNLIEFLSSLK